MTASADSPVNPAPEGVTPKSLPRWLAKTDEWMSTGSEWLNPILVKEARQALKSKQFVITFLVMLAAGWIWSMLMIAWSMPDIYYATSGPELLRGYCVILGFPIIVVVPISTFRSLATELEDGTLELVSISSLTSRQIVTGKLATAILQTLIYFSGLAPCIAFTYLLRGVGMSTIAAILFCTFVAGVAFSSVGLFVATLSKSRTWQTLFSVLMVIVLVYLYSLYCVASSDVVMNGDVEIGVEQPEFAWLSFFVLSQIAGFVLLALVAATAKLQFPSENRSTPLRWVMLLQSGIFVYWLTFMFAAEPYSQMGFASGWAHHFIVFNISIAAIYWAVMGSLMQGEHPHISLRTARSLPSNPLSKALLTWLGPGPGKGFVFATTTFLIICLWGYAGLVALERGFVSTSWRPSYAADQATNFLILCWSYFVIYLGITRLVMAGLRKLSNVSVMTSLLVAVLIFIGLSAVSLVPHAFFVGKDPNSVRGYSPWLLPSLPFTLYIAATYDIMIIKYSGIPYVMILVPFAGVVTYLLGIASSVAEVAQRHVVAPNRVVEDDRAKRKQAGKPLSPWQDDSALPPPPTAVDVIDLLSSEQEANPDLTKEL
jgi:ABC-type transport system involved in multi-copper enzyme maturation permease subunit